MKNETEYCYGLQSALEPIGQPVQHGYCRAAFHVINHLPPGERFVGLAGRLRYSSSLALCLLVALSLLAQVGSASLSAGDATTQVISTNGTQAVTITVLQSQPIASGRAGLMRPLDDSIGCASCPDSAVAWWAGEMDASDQLGAHNGIANSVGYDQGEVGQAFYFYGSGFVQVDNASLIFSSWSFEAWVDPTTAVDSQVWLVGQNYGRQLLLRPGTSGPKVALAVSTDPYNWQVLEGAEIPLDEWSHVVGVCDSASGTLTLYTNGVPSQPAALGLTPWDSGCDWTIGGVDLCGYSGQFFSGGLDEVTIYNTALSAAQIQALYNAGVAGKCIPEFNATRDLLLIYNTNSTNSIFVKDYYLANRPMVAGANVLGIACAERPSFFPEEYTNALAVPVLNWLTNHPTLRPQYVVLFLGIPWRVNTNALVQYDTTWPRPCVQYQLSSWCAPGWHPYVTAINMSDISPPQTTTSACVAYINKLASMGARNSPGKLILSASAVGYGTHNYYFDGSADGGGGFGAMWDDPTPAVASADPAASIVTVAANDYGSDLGVHITTGANVAGYVCRGSHSALSNDYSNGKVNWTGNSDWWIIETYDSWNGCPCIGMCDYFAWFSPQAFGGTDYSNTPVGASTNVDEPGTPIDPSRFFGLWAAGNNFAICAWNSSSPVTPLSYQAVGDPFVTK